MIKINETTLHFLKDILNDRGFLLVVQQTNSESDSPSGNIHAINNDTKEKVQYGYYRVEEVFNDEGRRVSSEFICEIDLTKLKNDIRKLEFYHADEIKVDTNKIKPYVAVNAENDRAHPKLFTYLAEKIDVLNTAFAELLGVEQASKTASHVAKKSRKKDD